MNARHMVVLLLGGAVVGTIARAGGLGPIQVVIACALFGIAYGLSGAMRP